MMKAFITSQFGYCLLNISQPSKNIVFLVLLRIPSKYCYKLVQLYCKLRQRPIKHYGKKWLQITATLLQTMTESNYKLRQLFHQFLKITAALIIITNYVKKHYKL